MLRDNRIILHRPEVLFSGIKGNKKNPLAPRVTFFINLKEHSREFLLTSPMVWILIITEYQTREMLKWSLEQHCTYAHGAFNELLGPGNGEISGVSTRN